MGWGPWRATGARAGAQVGQSATDLDSSTRISETTIDVPLISPSSHRGPLHTLLVLVPGTTI